MKPMFTGSYVFHCMTLEGEITTLNFEEMNGGFECNRQYENHSYAYADDGGQVGEAARDALMAHFICDTLKDGDYVNVMVAGKLDYGSYTDWESGATEGTLDIVIEWECFHVMTKEERNNFDDLNGIPRPWPWPKAEDFGGDIALFDKALFGKISLTK